MKGIERKFLCKRLQTTILSKKSKGIIFVHVFNVIRQTLDHQTFTIFLVDLVMVRVGLHVGMTLLCRGTIMKSINI